MSPRRGMALAVAGCVVSGAALLLGPGSLTPWALVALAGAVAILATRRWGRVPVGLVLAASGGIAASDGAGRVALAAGVLLVAVGLWTAVRGTSWPALGARYDAPQRRDDAWAALDRGEDPTA